MRPPCRRERLGPAPDGTLGSLADSPTEYDLALFLALNEEYASHPLKTTAPSIHDEPKRRARLERIAADIDRQLEPFGGLKGRRALDFGSGRGDLAIALADQAGCSSVVGVDIRAYPEWELLTHPRVEFLHADLSDEHVARGLQDEFDVIVSNSVFEHVVHPFAALQGLSRTVRPGGLMWLSANLYRGPLASHRYREVFFPWPHLLFTDHVFSQFYEWHSSTQRSASWVNKLTHLHYREYFAELGLEVLAEHFSTTPIDEAFYARFESVLGRYPRSDLEKDFIKVILRRPARHASVRMLDRGVDGVRRALRRLSPRPPTKRRPSDRAGRRRREGSRPRPRRMDD